MRSRFEFSLKGLFALFGILMGIGALAAVPAGTEASRIVQGVWLTALLGFFLAGSVVTVVRMWRARGDRDAFWRAAHGGQLSLLPRVGRRWVLDERDQD